MSEFALILVDWFRENGRELPWRGTKDPYAVWLSEVILQQTQVRQGCTYWERFMQRWPTVDRLAAATEDEVLREWQGLGYYSRARNLHAAARQVVALGGFPQTFEGLRALKGVGDYTAAAIASIVFNQPTAVVDGNVYRVLSRHFGIDTPINTSEGKKEFAALAQSLLPVASASSELAGIYNQAIMDFGALQCTPQSPRCPQCPLQVSCVAFREGRADSLPVKLKTLKVKERRLVYIYIRCHGCTAIRRRPVGDIWQGLYEPWLFSDTISLSVSSDKSDTSDASAPSAKSVPSGAMLLRQNVKHVLTHRILYADFYLLTTDTRPSLPPDYFWTDEADLEHYAVPRLVEILLASLPRER